MFHRIEYLVFGGDTARQLVDRTERVRAVVRASGVSDGLVSFRHITSAVYGNDDERGLREDIAAWVERRAPSVDDAHRRSGETDGDAHLPNLLLGHQVVLPVRNGDLYFGPWEQVFYVGFDGSRRQRGVVKLRGEERSKSNPRTAG